MYCETIADSRVYQWYDSLALGTESAQHELLDSTHARAGCPLRRYAQASRTTACEGLP